MSPPKDSKPQDLEISNPHTTCSSDDNNPPKLAHTTSIPTASKFSEKRETTSTESPSKSEHVSLEKTEKMDKVIKVNGEEGEEENHEYISGYKILVVMIAITLTTFLALLDTTIVATVSFLILFLR